MEERLNQRRGFVCAELSISEDHAEISAEYLAVINSRIKPLEPITASDIHVRTMYIVSDQINSYGGRFPVDEFPKLVELLVDSPVLIGHRKDRLPIGRTFHAEITERNGSPWIACRFYWLKSTEGAESLRENIDGGVVKECSIGFVFLIPECSLCGDDIRQCRHIPLETYIVSGEEHQCHFNYRAIQRVLETSLVYRGATPDTSITRELAITKSPNEDETQPTEIRTTDYLPEQKSYLVIPSYEGVDIRFRLRNGNPIAWRDDGRKVDLKIFGFLRSDSDTTNTVWRGRIVGYRGKERCSRAETERFLQNGSGPVSRLTLSVFPNETPMEMTAVGATRHRVQTIRHRRVSRSELVPSARLLMTKRGVEILCDEYGGGLRAYLYHPNESAEQVAPKHGVTLFVGDKDALLQFVTQTESRSFVLRDFSADLFMRGRRFVAEPSIDEVGSTMRRSATLLNHATANISSHGDAVVLEFQDGSFNALCIRPIVLNGKNRFLCYHRGGTKAPMGRSMHV